MGLAWDCPCAHLKVCWLNGCVAGKGRVFLAVSFGPAPSCTVRFCSAEPSSRPPQRESFRLCASLTDLPRGARTAPVTGLSAGRGAEGTTRALERFRTFQIKLCLARVFRTCASSGGPVTSRGKPGLRQRECKEGMTRGRPDGQEKEPSPHGPAPLPPPAPVNLRLGQRQPQPRAGASSARSGRGSAPLRTPP